MFSNKSSQKPGPILAFYYVRLLHAVTCPFSKYFQILCIFVKISKCFALFGPFLPFFWGKKKKITHMPLLSRIGPANLKRLLFVLVCMTFCYEKALKG